MSDTSLTVLSIVYVSIQIGIRMHTGVRFNFLSFHTNFSEASIYPCAYRYQLYLNDVFDICHRTTEFIHSFVIVS